MGSARAGLRHTKLEVMWVCEDPLPWASYSRPRDKRMQGHWLYETRYYRCRFPAEYALATQVDHPRHVYLRQAAFEQDVDRWLASAFTPPLCVPLRGGGPIVQQHVRVEALRRSSREIVDC